jgi:hypothetical protein
VQRDRAAEIRDERIGVRDVVRIDRRAEADRDDQEKERERGERDAVAEQAAVRLRTRPCDCLVTSA